MKTGDILKWVLIAGAAYLVYRYLNEQGYFGATSAALPAAATTPALTTSTGVVAASPTPSQGTTTALVTTTTAPAATIAASPITPVQTSPGTATAYSTAPLPTGMISAGNTIPSNAIPPAEMEMFASTPAGKQMVDHMTASLEGLTMDQLLAELRPYRSRWGVS
jgi:hypothetical protein